MKKYIFSFVFIITLIFPALIFAQGAICAEVEPFCTDFGASFPASTNTNAEPGNQYGCLITRPNPAWYYLQIDSPGDLEITLTNSNNVDIDFIVYGPYPDLQVAQSNCGSFQAQETGCPLSGTCPNGVPCDFFNGCVNGDGVDCSYDPQSVEVADIPNAQVGEVYVFLITNFSGLPTDISVNQTSGGAGTDCSIVECRTVSFLQNTPGGLDLLPATIDCTSSPLELVARPGNMPEPNGFITPALGIQIGTDASAPFQNSLEIYNGPDGTGDLIGYWAPVDMGGPYRGPIEGGSDFIAFGEYLDPTLSYSFIWCDNQQTGFFQYEVINYALDEAPNNVLAMGNLNNNNQECFTVNFGAPTGTATFTGAGITDTGTGRAIFDPSGLAPGTYTITYSWDDGDNCSGSEAQTIEVTCAEDCVRSGGQVVGPTMLELCFEDEPFILETINEITDPAIGLPDVLWAVWVLDDPLNLTTFPAGGPLPDDQDIFDDANYIGVWNNGPGQIVFGDNIELIPDGSGATYYIAPLIGLGTFGTIDLQCTGLDPAQGYTIYMNPPLNANVTVNNCNIQVDLTGGYPRIDNTAEYSWSYTTPNGQTITGTGTPINVVGGTDGNYTFSITNDGNDCDLLNFATVTLNGCGCMADAGTFFVNNTIVCYDDVLQIISNGDYGGSFEGGISTDNVDGDMYNGVAYAVFSQPPSGVYFPDDPNFIGLLGVSPNIAGIEQPAQLSAGTNFNGTPILPNSTWFFTTVYSFDVDDSLFGVDFGVDGTIDCFDSNPDQAISVTFLDSIGAAINQFCNADGSVDISFELSGGFPDFNGSNYTITGDGVGGTVASGGTYIISNHPAGEPYVVVVGDEGGQGCGRTFTGNAISPPTVTFTSVDGNCGQMPNGSAVATAADGNPPYTYNWSNNANTPTITNLASGTYTLTVTDDLGCTATGEVTIIQPIADGGTFTVNNTAICYDDVLEITSNGDYSGPFEGGILTDNVDGDMYNGVGYAVFSQPPSGVYFPDDPNFVGILGTSPNIAGLEQTSTLGVGTNFNGTPILPGITIYVTTAYSFDVDDDLYGVDFGVNGTIDCFDSNPDQAIAITFLDSIDVVIDQICNDDGGVDITFEFSGGFPDFDGSNYTVTGDGPGGTVAPGEIYTISNHPPGIPYSITVSDDGGQVCSRTYEGSSLFVPTVELTSTDADCLGNANGTATATPGGGSGTYSFEWSNNQMTSTITGLFGGTYTVTVTDNLGCAVTGEVEVGQPLGNLSVVAVADSVSCNNGDDGSITAMPMGGTEPYTYQWSTSVASTQTLGGLAAGVYSVTVFDTDGCEATATAQVEQPTLLGAFLDNVVSPTCFGESNGSIEGVPTGGTPPFSYVWTNGQMTQNVADLPTGFYGLTVTDANGCEAFASTTLSEPALLTLNTNTDADASCEVSMDGQISTAAAGGTTPYTYAWSHDGTLNADTAPSLNPGNYSVTVTDAQGCITTADAFVASTVIITDAGTTVDVGCNGESTGSITANPSGSPNLPYSYTWSANANTGNSQTATGLAADFYTLTIIDAVGCSTTAQYVINEPTELLIGAMVDNNILCNGENNGQATAAAAGGTPDYNYQWSASANNQNTPTATNLPVGMHSVTVTDDNACIATAEIEIIEPPILNLILGSNEVSCTGGSDGFVTATPQGGTPDASGSYDYQWSANTGGQTTATVFNLPIGIYAVTVTDASGCIVTGEAEVIEPTELLVNTIVDDNVSCNGGSDGQATATASGGSLEEFNPDADYTYQWSASADNQTTATATNLPAGIHTISVTDFKGCLTTAEITITEPTPVIVDIVIDNNVNCNGGTDAQATATASGGTPDAGGNYTYQWDANASNQNSPTAIGLPAGTYTITVTDANGCTGTNSVEITEPNTLALIVNNDMDVSCFGGNGGAASATASGGTPDLNGNYNYEWSASAGGFVTPTVTTLPAGTHTVTVTDDNGCTITGSVDISEPEELTVSIDLINNVSCASGNDGAVTANPNGGTPNAAGNYMYQWSASTGNQTSQFANNLPTGIHTLTVTDDNGCIATSEIEITEPTALGLTLTVDQDVNCGGGMDGAATATPSDGTPDATGNYNYQWSASAGNQMTASVANLPAGTHTVTVTDDNGCEISGEVTVAEPPALSVDINLVNNVNCGGGMDGEATAIPTGGTPDTFGNYTYQWSASANDQATATASGLTAMTHTVTVTDANGCTAINSIEITEPVPVTAMIDISPVNCNGGLDGSATANPSGGTPNPDGSYNYQWSANAGGVFTQTASGLAADTYTVIITDANGCSTPPINVTVSEPLMPLTLAISGQAPSCNANTDGSATVDPTGGTPSYSYEWSASAGSQSTQTALNIVAGTHSVTVTDLNGCTEIAEITIDEPETLGLTLTPTDPACFGELTGSITATVTGGTLPYTYEWSDGQMTATADTLAQGNHSVIVTDANGCTITDNLTLTAPPEIVLDINTQLTSCVGSCDGTASVLANGGAGGFTYEWDNGETTSTATALCPGPHTVTVTDATGCEVVGNLTINGPTPIFPGGPGPTPVSCVGGNDGAITIEPAGGTPSYTYEWFANGMSLGTDSGASSTISDLVAGIYTLVITDANGCSTPPVNITVIEPLFPLTLDASGEGPSCNGGNDGFATVEPEGGTASYSYQWSAETGFQDTQTAFNLVPGTYAVTVSDANGCTETAEVNIGEPSAVEFSLSSMPATCFGDENGIIIIENATGGTPPYTYSVDNEIFVPDSTIFGLAAGLYTVYVQDVGGCVFTDEILVEQPFEVIVDAGPDVEILFGDSIRLSAQINQPPGNDFGFTWSPPEGLDCTDCDEPYAMPLEDMTYIVTALDSITGCRASDDIRVNVNKDRNIFIPNAFSPDGDGANDIFMIFGGQGVVEVLSFRIYDRWGELVFEDSNFTTNDPEHGWDGTFRGQESNPGVFVFFAEVEFIDGVRIPYTGDVTLVR